MNPMHSLSPTPAPRLLRILIHNSSRPLGSGPGNSNVKYSRCGSRIRYGIWLGEEGSGDWKSSGDAKYTAASFRPRPLNGLEFQSAEA
jgi:hypothetical protein